MVIYHNFIHFWQSPNLLLFHQTFNYWTFHLVYVLSAGLFSLVLFRHSGFQQSTQAMQIFPLDSLLDSNWSLFRDLHSFLQHFLPLKNVISVTCGLLVDGIFIHRCFGSSSYIPILYCNFVNCSISFVLSPLLSYHR